MIWHENKHYLTDRSWGACDEGVELGGAGSEDAANTATPTKPTLVSIVALQPGVDKWKIKDQR